MRGVYLAVCIGCIVIVSCTPNDAEAGSRAQARRVADAYLNSISTSNPERPVSVEDQGDKWLVVYHGPVDWAGGDRLVWVDKKTMTVIDTVAYQ